MVAIIFLSFTFINVCHGGIFSWLFQSVNNPDSCVENCESEYHPIEQNIGKISSRPKDIEDEIFAVKVPFEISSSDEKFLSELKNYVQMEVSELDVCNHKVVLNLKSSCPSLTEEDISKVAVNLLNCQSAVEGRKLYPCTQNMQLHQCTNDMDQTTWNAYHIMSNRVRAVCYQLRNVQFRAKTEIVVNKLVHTAEEQIGAMKQLEESQNILKESTSETLDVVNLGYLKLQNQQKELSSAHINIHNYVSSNLRELSKEKKLIAAGQKEIALITLTIKKKIEEAQKQLQLQENGQRSVHQKILIDLSQIQESANKVWVQLDKSTQKILETHEVTAAHYGKLMGDLEKMNDTVKHLTNVLITMRQKVEEKFFWISSLLGDTDATVQKIYFFILHLCYCLIGMIAASFLQVPYATRIALIVLVPFNVFLELNNETSLPLSTLSFVLVVCLFLNVSSIGIINIYQWRKNTLIRTSNGNIRNIHQPTKNLTTALTSNEVFLASSTPAKLTLSNKKSYKNNCSTTSFDEEYSSEDEGSFCSKSKKSEINNGNSFLKPCSPLPKIFEEEDLHRKKTYLFNEKDKISTQNNVSSVCKQLLNLRQEDDDKHLLFYTPSKSHLNTSLRSNGRRSRSSTPIYDQRNNRSSTPRSLCSAICKNGFLCKNFASPESSVCFRHTDESTGSAISMQ